MTDAVDTRGPSASAGQPSALDRAIEELDGVGPTRARKLKKLGLNRLGDLLEYFPRTYQQEFAEGSIAQLKPDQIHTDRGTVVAVAYVPVRPRPRFEATLDDGTGKLALVWFHGAWMRTKVHPGVTLRVRGKVKHFRNLPQMANAKWEIVDDDAPAIGEETYRAIYPASQDLPSD